MGETKEIEVKEKVKQGTVFGPFIGERGPWIWWAMGSPLGPALANIFVGSHESRLFDNTTKPAVYFRYVDVPLISFGSGKLLSTGFIPNT